MNNNNTNRLKKQEVDLINANNRSIIQFVKQEKHREGKIHKMNNQGGDRNASKKK